jgi:uncharacterized phage protein gp47/JayE
MTTSPYTLEDLMTAEDAATIRARLLAALLADGQPTASWAPSEVGGVENLRADMVAGGLAFYMAQRVANLVNGRLLALATDTPENGYWLTYLGKRFYKLQKRAATYTIQNIRLAAAATASADSFGDGDLWVSSPATGNRYRLTLADGERISITPGGTVDGPFRAENPGASYNDAAGTITNMVTAKAGITCVNTRASSFEPTRSTNPSTGTVTVQFTFGLPTFTVLRVRINASGNVGTGSWSYSIDGGFTWVTGGVIPDVGGVPNVGLRFTDGSATPAFVAGAIFTLRVGDCFIQRGSDAESDDAFKARCSNRHPARSLVPLKAHIDLWAHNASDEVHKVASDADTNTPGGILVTIASQTGPASPAAQQAVEDYIGARLGHKGVPAPTSPAVVGSKSPEETVLVSSAEAFQVTASATVYVPKAQLAAAQAGADVAWNAYLAGLPIGGQLNAVVDLESFYTVLGDLGADDVQGLTLNGAAADLTIPVRQVAVPASSWTLRANLSWVAT